MCGCRLCKTVPSECRPMNVVFCLRVRKKKRSRVTEGRLERRTHRWLCMGVELQENINLTASLHLFTCPSLLLYSRGCSATEVDSKFCRRAAEPLSSMTIMRDSSTLLPPSPFQAPRTLCANTPSLATQGGRRLDKLWALLPVVGPSTATNALILQLARLHAPLFTTRRRFLLPHTHSNPTSTHHIH